MIVLIIGNTVRYKGRDYTITSINRDHAMVGLQSGFGEHACVLVVPFSDLEVTP